MEAFAAESGGMPQLNPEFWISQIFWLTLTFGIYLSGAMRNPSAAQKQFPNLLLGFALAEATGLFGLVVALIILFAF